MNVLVIEDDKRIASLVERALIGDGHRVTLSHNGREGADMLLAAKYDAALLDILLPGMDGFEVLERVRARHCKTPVLVLTAVDTVPRILNAFDLGADDYLVKPFILEILLPASAPSPAASPRRSRQPSASAASPSTADAASPSAMARTSPSPASSSNCSRPSCAAAASSPPASSSSKPAGATSPTSRRTPSTSTSTASAPSSGTRTTPTVLSSAPSTAPATCS